MTWHWYILYAFVIGREIDEWGEIAWHNYYWNTIVLPQVPR